MGAAAPEKIDEDQQSTQLLVRPCMTGRLATVLGAVLLGVALAGCGKTQPPALLVERTFGTGSHQVWVFQQKGLAPKSVVVFLHGLGSAAEETPVNHLP